MPSTGKKLTFLFDKLSCFSPPESIINQRAGGPLAYHFSVCWQCGSGNVSAKIEPSMYRGILACFVKWYRLLLLHILLLDTSYSYLPSCWLLLSFKMLSSFHNSLRSLLHLLQAPPLLLSPKTLHICNSQGLLLSCSFTHQEFLSSSPSCWKDLCSRLFVITRVLASV